MKKLFLTSALIIGFSLGSTTALAADKINVLASGMPLTFSASDGYGIPFIDQNGRTYRYANVWQAWAQRWIIGRIRRKSS